MNVVAYARVSTEEQAEEGISLDAQIDQVYRWAELAGHKVINDFADRGLSGSNTKRPGFQEAIEFAIRHKAILAVYSLSRASRSVRDTYEILDRLEKQGAAFASVTEHIDTSTAAGKLIFGVLAVFAQFEREIIAERTRTALQHKKFKGERVGSIPYGYRVGDDGKTLEVDDVEMCVCGKIHFWRSKGYSLRDIQEHLARDGHTNRKGRIFRLDTINEICQRNANVA